MKYKVLLFDADDTLFDYEKAEYSALEMTFNNFNLDYDSNFHLSKYKEVNHEIWSELERKKITPDELKTERFRRLFNLLSIQNIDPIKFGNNYLINLSKGHYLIPFANETIKELHNNFTMAIVTNGLREVQRPRFYNSGISEYFKEIIISDEIGIAKPDSRIFEYALKQLNHTHKQSVLMIGDKLNSDIIGGNNYGIDTCWVNLAGTTNSTNIDPTYEIDSISKIKEIVLA